MAPATPDHSNGSPPQPPRKRRILVVDDHEILRAGWHHLISVEDDLEICGEAGTVTDALDILKQTHPDIVVTDINLPGRNGLDLVKEIKTLYPEIPVLAVSVNDERIYGERVLKAGGVGYIMKEAATGQLVEAIRRVLSGKQYVSPALSEVYLKGMVSGHPSRFPLNRLTNREMAVFELIGRGQSLEQIAEQLGCKPRTVEAHRTHIREKLGLANSNELLRYAVRHHESGGQSPEDGR